MNPHAIYEARNIVTRNHYAIYQRNAEGLYPVVHVYGTMQTPRLALLTEDELPAYSFGAVRAVVGSCPGGLEILNGGVTGTLRDSLPAGDEPQIGM
ncbi:hypothetical protein IU474_16810 [Nocardia otitidiscaviarum]|uniref:hypothetical protein n=1 Tax=Nocardia otitidiscaviarum TaxID=1823 RepID=UPI0018941CCA|nr:hypothetical protein [Nocardia otitidiscaviarum]MBF6238712.1 hypothetical protein [Nocardia otitidiscaviarum]